VANKLDNLIPFTSDQDREEARKNGIKGGIASGKARREKATMLQMLEKCLEAKNEKTDKSYKELVTFGLIKGAINGSSKNYEIIQSLMEKKEAKDSQVDIIITIPARDIGSSFVDLNRDIDDREHREYYVEGGRGSTKSSFISEKIIELMENNPRMCTIAMRKVKDTLKDSVYAQLEWAINKLSETYPQLKDEWKITKSPLEMVNIKTGQIIYFRGADDYGKIKSIKPPQDKYIGIEWFEEFDQFNGMNEIRKINQSVIRGGEDFIQFYSYNTPASSQHFVNIEKIVPKENRLVHLSDYRTVPKKWLGQPFIDDAEFLKSVNERLYNNEYLGQMTGVGGNVFENVELREISDEEINNFDYIYQGIDWGYFPDPFAWIKCCYDSSQKILYIYDEYTANKTSNSDAWNYLKEEKGVKEDDLIIADSSEPKSVADFKSYGALIRGAEKGAGSVDYSMKWLSSLVKIVIDVNRCPMSAQEFSTYEYQQDKDGNYISGYVDANNHCIDATRYALNNIWKKKGQ
jgi:PBSX family phage terminase large subunit